MPSVDKLIEAGYPVWIVFIAVVLPLLMTFSKNLGNLNTILGSANRWWQGRQERAVSKTITLDDKIEEAVTNRLDIIMKPINYNIKCLQESLEESNLEVDKLRVKLNKALKEIAYRDAYSLDQARYIRHIEEWSIKEGLEIPAPPHKPALFIDWLNDYLEKEDDPDDP